MDRQTTAHHNIQTLRINEQYTSVELIVRCLELVLSSERAREREREREKESKEREREIERDRGREGDRAKIITCLLNRPFNL
jgi:hypothetical protein